MEGYNGWKNRETWNVALWINNDEAFYGLAKAVGSYEEFRKVVGTTETPDGVAWDNSELDVKALDEVIREAR